MECAMRFLILCFFVFLPTVLADADPVSVDTCKIQHIGNIALATLVQPENNYFVFAMSCSQNNQNPQIMKNSSSKKEVKYISEKQGESQNLPNTGNPLKLNTKFSTPTDVLIEYINRLNKGKYREALHLFAFDFLSHENVTYDYFRSYADEKVTKNKTVAKIEGLEEIRRYDNTVRVVVKIYYKDGTNVIRNLRVFEMDGQWMLTSRGSLW